MSKKNKYYDPYAVEGLDNIIAEAAQTPSMNIGDFDENGDPIVDDRGWGRQETPGTPNVPSYADYINAKKGKKKQKKHKHHEMEDDDYDLLSPVNGAEKNPKNLEKIIAKAHMESQKEAQRKENNFTRVEDLFAELEDFKPGDGDYEEEDENPAYQMADALYQQQAPVPEDSDMGFDPNAVSEAISLHFSYENRFGRLLVDDSVCSFSDLDSSINPDVFEFDPANLLYLMSERDDDGNIRFSMDKYAMVMKSVYTFFIINRHPAGIFTKQELVEYFGNVEELNTEEFLFFGAGVTDAYYGYHITRQNKETLEFFINRASALLLSYISEELEEYNLKPLEISCIAGIATYIYLIINHMKASDCFLMDNPEYVKTFQTATENVNYTADGKIEIISKFNMAKVLYDVIQNHPSTKIGPMVSDLELVEERLGVDDLHDRKMIGLNILGAFQGEDEEEDEDEIDEMEMDDVLKEAVAKLDKGIADMVSDFSEDEEEDDFDFTDEDLRKQIMQYASDDTDYERVSANMNALSQAADILSEISGGDKNVSDDALKSVAGGISLQVSVGKPADDPKDVTAFAEEATPKKSEPVVVEEVKPVEPEPVESVGTNTMSDALKKAGMVIPVVRKRPNN